MDIGGGSGLTSFYAAALGAKRVDLIEPLGDGSGNVEISNFKKFKECLGNISKNVELHNSKYQNYKSTEKYDIIIMHNSINHLDEPACINLLRDQKSYSIYKNLFQSMYDYLKNNGIIIIADCTNNNFFNKVGIKSPLTSDIEWKKHQKPETWIKILHEVGFSESKFVWTSQKQLRSIGKILFSNRIAAYFLLSHFIIHSKKIFLK